MFKGWGLSGSYNLKSWITVSVMCQEMSVNQGIKAEEAVEQREFLMASVTWQSYCTYPHAVVALSQTGETLYSRYLQNKITHQLTKLVLRRLRSSVLKWYSQVSNKDKLHVLARSEVLIVVAFRCVMMFSTVQSIQSFHVEGKCRP